MPVTGIYSSPEPATAQGSKRARTEGSPSEAPPPKRLKKADSADSIDLSLSSKHREPISQLLQEQRKFAKHLQHAYSAGDFFPERLINVSDMKGRSKAEKNKIKGLNDIPKNAHDRFIPGGRVY